MKRTPIKIDPALYPSEFHTLLSSSKTYDSSCSDAAKVIYIDRDCGYFLKSAEKGALEKEALLWQFFQKKKLTSRMCSYISGERDFLLTEKVSGEDCTHSAYLEKPERLCDLYAEILRSLHETDFSECPVLNRMESYLETASENFSKGAYDSSLFPDNWGLRSADEAWKTLEEGKHLLKHDILIHGDFCLPNVVLDDWNFSGFIDLGNGGAGDRHIDLFWGAWSLSFNLKTDKFKDRFFDAYGRDKIDSDVLRIVAAAEVFG